MTVEGDDLSGARTSLHPSGFVYVLSNPAMPGYLKIGQTIENPYLRARALFTTGIPEPFRLELAFFVRDRVAAEEALHSRFAAHRVPSDREFFRLALGDAYPHIMDVVARLMDTAIHREIPADEMERLQREALGWRDAANEAFRENRRLVDEVATLRALITELTGSLEKASADYKRHYDYLFERERKACQLATERAERAEAVLARKGLAAELEELRRKKVEAFRAYQEAYHLMR